MPRVVAADGQLVGRVVGFEVAGPGGAPSLRLVVFVEGPTRKRVARAPDPPGTGTTTSRMGTVGGRS